ncbi:SPOR domain-containing protein [Zobellia nedashkovskayae]|uniref:SPOR domain-containing protein n=1 Tax=Zobellia nedashkovskayae TaxID=2779510 RepID=UPI001889DC87|nr:hypothetical protein [Zobellia nedashkovskayae]
MNPKKDVFETSEEKWNFIIALIVIGLFSVFIYQFFFKSEENLVAETPTDLDESQIESASYSKIDEKENQYLYVGSKTYELKKIKTEDAHLIEIDSAVVISDIINSKPVVLETVLETESSDSKTIAPIDEQKEDLEITEPSKDKMSIKDTIATPEASSETDVKAPPAIERAQAKPERKTDSQTTNLTYNCVIIVGVFREQNNKIAIIEKLKSMGYNYSEGVLRKGMNYVGVPTACNDEPGKQKLLQELNIAFGIDSWVKKL